MESGITSVVACEGWFWADQPDTEAVGVVVYLPCSREEHLDGFIREEAGSAVRSIQHAYIPFRGIFRDKAKRRSERCMAVCHRLAERQHVARAKRSPAMPAELPEHEG